MGGAAGFLRRLASLGCVLALGLAFAQAGSAGAAIIQSTATAFTGDPLSVSIEIDDESDPGHLLITLAVEGDGAIGDLRGFFAHVSDESLLPGLSVSGPQVTGSVFDANAVLDLGGGANLNGGGSPCPCDLGIEIGRPGIGRGDDYQSVSFKLSHLTEDLTVGLLPNAFGIRVTSVGADREGSSKLVGVVPEPSTAVSIGMGLACLAASGRSRHAA